MRERILSEIANNGIIFSDFFNIFFALIDIEIILLYFRDQKFAIPSVESAIKSDNRSKILLKVGTKAKAKSQILYISQKLIEF